MTSRPILFSTPMVQTLLAGQKTQTRRIVKPQPQPNGGKGLHPVRPYQTSQGKWTWVLASTGMGDGTSGEYCPYGHPDDLLWVRECFSYLDTGSISPKGVWYWADGNPEYGDWSKPKPSIHMPRWASRLTLELTEVRVERLKSICEMDAYAEGVDTEGDAYIAAEHGKLGGANGPAASICAYADLWDTINGPGSWDANPWVWALEFMVHHCNVDSFLAERAA